MYYAQYLVAGGPVVHVNHWSARRANGAAGGVAAQRISSVHQRADCAAQVAPRRRGLVEKAGANQVGQHPGNDLCLIRPVACSAR